MRLKSVLMFLVIVVCAGVLAIVLMSGKVVPVQPAITRTLTSTGMCHIRMVPRDKAPGNGWKEHNKFISVESDTDYTDMYRDGTVYITYNDPLHGGWYFDTDSYWVQTDAHINVWDIRTRWTWFNPAFASGKWQLWYPC